MTPVYRRFYLTKVCLEQRARMIERLPFEAHCVVIGDDENLDVARELGFDIVEKDNQYVAAKFNAGYRHAVASGATHCMPIGSDSWLHESVFGRVGPNQRHAGPVERKALGIVGLSSFSPDGQERVDLSVKYPAGFGVGMVYPAFAVAAKRYGGEAAEPTRQRGIDNSTWARVGRGQVQIEFLPYQAHRYINFHSTEDSITDFIKLRTASNRTLELAREDTFGPLRELYDADLIEDMERYYALRSLQIFLTGRTPEFFNPHQRVRRRYPYVAGRNGGTTPYEGGKPSRYPNIGLRNSGKGVSKAALQPREYEKIADRRSRKERGLPLSRDEEIAERFDRARGL